MGCVCIPNGAQNIIDTLEASGYEAYVVGGCVRDSLLGIVPHDWDICTSAVPSEIESCFEDRRIVETGLQHGTVTIIEDGVSYEVTTFRIDGKYSDSRHPDKVTYTKDIDSDLSRRDFTFNAMAYNERVGLIDPFGGAFDLIRGEISCVGNANDRFKEDALRIMRALRFASTYGFTISERTNEAIHINKKLLNNIAAERIREELCKIVMGKGVLGVLLNYSDIIATIIPEIEPCIGFQQNNPYHQYTVYDHIAHAVSNYSGDDQSVKLALLLHDIGKPLCYTEDEKGGHFYGHGVYCHDVAEKVMERLRFDNRTSDEVLTLVLYHDAIIEPTTKAIKRWLNKIGPQRFCQLMDVRMADILAHTKGTQASRVDKCNMVKAVLEQVIEEEQCFSISDLAINGHNIMDLGVPEGKRVGEILKKLLDAVIAEDIENEHTALVEYAKGCV
ncbi:HD domain-containing protein [Oscillospiraceae bacterium 21-37]